MEIAITTLMKNHVYQFGGKLYIRKEGGSIGMATTGVIARIRMLRWSRKFKELCRENRLGLRLYKVYVDDESQLWDEMEMGRRWNGKKMEWKEEWFNEDKEKGEETDKRMMREILKMANTIEPDIEVTADIPSENEEGKLPVLDLKMWVEQIEGEGGESYPELRHEYYEKGMVAPRVIDQKSALSERIKRTTLTQEVIRIRKNTSSSIRDGKKGEQMTRLSWKMWRSGYNEKSRREIIIAGLKGFQRLVDLEEKGIRSLNRSRRENWAARRLKKFRARN